MFNWPFSKRYYVRCPDGSTKMIFKSVDDAFPLSVSDSNTKVSGDVNVLEHVKGSLAAEYASQIQGLMFQLDEANRGLMIDLRAAYVSYLTDPCKYGESFNRQVDGILVEQQRLRGFKVKVQSLIALAQLHPNSPDQFLPAFVALIHQIGGPAEAVAASLEIGANREIAATWARGHK